MSYMVKSKNATVISTKLSATLCGNMKEKTKSKNIFFLGKGGVGKSTSAALTALHLSRNGYKTLLVSMDPAHNQSDIFERSFSEKPVAVNDYLSVIEVNTSKQIDKYLANIQNQVKRAYSYLTAFNLEKYFDVLKFSPGIEEHALLLAFQNIRKTAGDTAYLIFDMPPTALTLKFLTLPDLSLLWLNNLLDLRQKTLEKKAIVTRVKFGKKELETDKIKSKLQQQIADYEQLKNLFKDPQHTVLYLVLNTDKLSFNESKLIVEKLDKFQIPVSNVFLNKYYNGFDVSAIQNLYAGAGLQILPQADSELTGLENLSAYLGQLDDFMVF